ncbi:hypothetical protein PYW07_006811 [Mythimna separata]|uniref:Phospholipid scramblase n=1 Tax=Mythimna separata TaxID=271217 RepID=A0AAD8E0Z2_MYTSE|nr:hypothetical protein PYW07_006811 [Mythimna separata]
MATASVSGQPGLERLMRLDRINVNQKGRGFKGNKYTVHSEGEVLFNLKEDGHALTFLAHGKNRGFHIDGVDNTGRKVFSLRRPGVFVTDKVELYMNEKLVCIVRKEATFMTPMFSINDANDSPTLRVKGEVTDYNFQLQTTTKKTIGGINKEFRGLLKEMFSYNDDYVISFPADLDVRFKLAVIATCVLIDYRYHES